MGGLIGLLLFAALFYLAMRSSGSVQPQYTGLFIGLFGEEFSDYRRRLPMFVPRLGEWRKLFKRSGVAAETVEPLPG